MNIEELHLLFDYIDGHLIWKVNRGSNKVKGKIAGYINTRGYRKIDINAKPYAAHHIVFALHHGYFPKEIDHINQIRDDNRIENLREVTHLENGKNQSKWSHNTSGVTGVSYCRKQNKWRSEIMVSKKSIYLGNFADKEDAIAARQHAERLYNFHPNHGKEFKNGKYRD